MPDEAKNSTNDFLAKFQALPDQVQDYFLDEKTADKMIKFGKDFRLTDEQKSALVDLAGELSVKSIDIKDILGELQKRLGLSAEATKKLAQALLGEYFLPLNEFYDEEVSKELERFGGKLEKFTGERIVIKKESAEDAMSEVIAGLSEMVIPENLAHRFRELIESRLREVRNDADLKKVLIKNPKVGGMGMDEAAAEKIVEAVREKVRSVKIVPQEKVKESRVASGELRAKNEELGITNQESRIKNQKEIRPSPPLARRGGDTGPLPLQKGEQERDLVKAEDRKNPPPSPPFSKGEGTTSAPSAINPRESKKMVSASEVAQEKQEAKSESGPDISEAELAREVQHIKHDLMPKAEVSSIDFKKIAGDIFARSQLKVSNADAESRLLTIILARLKDVRDSNETREILARDAALGGMSFDEQKINILLPLLDAEFKKIQEHLKSEQEEKIAASRREEEGRRKKAAEASHQAEQAVLDKRFKELVGKRGENKTAPLPLKKGERERDLKPLIPSLAESEHPKVQDIKPAHKLIGPVEEIGALTLINFRQLAPSAADAAKRIREKVEALKTDSLKKWQEGIAAWHASEPSKLYLKLLGQALRERKSIKQVAIDRQSRGEPFLSGEEIDAIMTLNKQLRF